MRDDTVGAVKTGSLGIIIIIVYHKIIYSVTTNADCHPPHMQTEEELDKKFRQKDKRRRKKMKVSGKQVQGLKDIIIKKNEHHHITSSPHQTWLTKKVISARLNSMITEIILLISAVLLIIAILMQNRGAGLGGAIGGGDGEIHHTKRGAEKGLFILTIIFSVVFLLSAFLNVLRF